MKIQDFSANEKIVKKVRQCVRCDALLHPAPVFSENWTRCEECGERIEPAEVRLYLAGEVLCAHCVYCVCTETESPCEFCEMTGGHEGMATPESVNAAVFKMMTGEEDG